MEQGMAGTPSDDEERAQRARTQRLGQGLAQWERTTVGVRITTDTLAALPPRRWTVLRGLRWPEELHGSVDHVVVGRSGIYVIDTKNWSGQVRVKNGMLLQGGQVRGVTGAGQAAEHVAGLLDRRTAATVRAVVCLARDEPIVGVVDEVFVCSTWNVRELLQSRPRALSRRRAKAVVRQLRTELRPHRANGGGHRSVRAGSGRENIVKDLLKAGVLMAGLVVVLSNPELVTEPAEWIGDRLADLVG
jgi:hypothetical protein